MLDQANFSAIEYDGMEKLKLMSATDWPHSSQTVNSGIFRGPAEPDWFAFQGWPVLPLFVPGLPHVTLTELRLQWPSFRTRITTSFVLFWY